MQIKEYFLTIKNQLERLSVFGSVIMQFKIFYYFCIFFFRSIYNLVLSILCYRNIKIFLSNHFTIGIWKLYRKRTKFPHPVGIVIGFKVELGYDCIIYQNVTIGTKDTVNYLSAKYPRIGNNVTIYPNSIILGDIYIGDNTVIGAGSIVLSNIPPNSIAYGNPAKVKIN